MDSISWKPALHVQQTNLGCRLLLAGVTYGDGLTLQDAADDLLARLRQIVMSSRRTGLRFTHELGKPDPRLLEFLRELGELAERGEDIRERALGPS